MVGCMAKISKPYRGTKERGTSDGMDCGKPLSQVPNNQELHQTENGEMDNKKMDATDEQTETSKERSLGKKKTSKKVETLKKSLKKRNEKQEKQEKQEKIKSRIPHKKPSERKKEKVTIVKGEP